MALFNDDPISQIAFSVHRNKGVYALLLGSGVSRASGILTGWEILDDLIRQVGVLQGVDGLVDWSKWYQDKTGNAPDYSRVLEELTQCAAERRKILEDYIEPTNEDLEEGLKVPTKAHQAIAELVRRGYIKLLITTNFDRLLETALREKGVEPTVVSSEDTLKGAVPIRHTECYIFKLHGDYKDTRILNIDTELESYRQSYESTLNTIFNEYGLIICGWSGEWDEALREAFFRSVNRRYPTYWCAQNEPGDKAKDLIRHRSATEVKIESADQFFERLREKVLTLEESNQQHPSDIRLRVDMVKRYLPKPEEHIRLDELLAEEVDTLVEAFDECHFLSGDKVSDDSEFVTRVTRIESATEPLARMAGVIGRWGDGKQIDRLQNTILKLHATLDKEFNFRQIYGKLRSYPVVIVFTAHALGLIRAERWADLYKFFTREEITGSDKQTEVVSVLYHKLWRGNDKRYWRLLEGLGDVKFPLSEHLYQVMCSWKDSFTGKVPDFELQFDWLEVLASLAWFGTLRDHSPKRTIRASGGTHGFLEIPIGRVGWRIEFQESSIVNELQLDSMIDTLLNVGFVHGDRKLYDVFVNYLLLTVITPF